MELCSRNIEREEIEENFMLNSIRYNELGFRPENQSPHDGSLSLVHGVRRDAHLRRKYLLFFFKLRGYERGGLNTQINHMF